MPSASMVATMKAVAAWPDGNELVIGRRMPYGSGSSSSKCSGGRSRPNSDFTRTFVSPDSRLIAVVRRRITRGSRLRTARAAPNAPQISPWSAALDRL